VLKENAAPSASAVTIAEIVRDLAMTWLQR
jgi:hypothetical protein